MDEETADSWVNKVLSNPKNLATEIELREQLKVAVALFKTADIDSSNSICFDELKMLCDQMGLPMENDEEEMLVKMDSDGSGALELEEWALWWLKRVSVLPNPLMQQEAIAKNTFAKFDVDHSGSINSSEFNELILALGAEFDENELAEALAEIDEDNSGMIDCNEFVLWWTNRAGNNRRNVSLISMKLKKLASKAAQIFNTDVFTAAWQGDLNLVKSFIDSEKRLVNATDDAGEYGEGWTPLHYAAYQGHLAIVEVLLSAGATVNKANDLGFTPLFYAAQRGHVDICRQLMQSGADPSLFGSCSSNPDALMDEPPAGGTIEHTEQRVYFMCPVDHVVDCPELRELFAEHPKCVPPTTLSKDSITCSLSTSGVLSLEIKQPSTTKSNATIPIQTYKLLLRAVSSEGSLLFELNVSVPAKLPGTTQSFSLDSTKKWFQSLVNKAVADSLQSLTLPGIDLSGITALWERVQLLHQSHDSTRKADLETTLLAAVKRTENVGQELWSTVSGELNKMREKSKTKATAGDAAVILTADQISKVVSDLATVAGQSNTGGSAQTYTSDAVQWPMISVKIAAQNALHIGDVSEECPVVTRFSKLRKVNN